MIDSMLKKKQQSAKDGVDMKEQQKKAEEIAAKAEQHKQRRLEKQAQLEKDAKESYLNLQQYQYLDKNIELASNRLKEQQQLIDMMEKKLIEKLKDRARYAEKKAQRRNSRASRGADDKSDGGSHLNIPMRK